MPDFNAAQTEAINARNRNILVSAAAGSGKTTVMVEKIKETLIRHPEASVSQFLVITFTRDAARNMKDKLRNLLEEAARKGEEQAARALGEIEIASISTIHSFCTQLLKEYNDNTGASMNPRVLKDEEKKQIMNECFSDASERIFTEKDRYSKADRQTVSFLMAAFNHDEIRKMVQDLYNVLMGIPYPFDFLEKIVREPPCALWNREIMTSIDLDVLGLEECLRREQELQASGKAGAPAGAEHVAQLGDVDGLHLFAVGPVVGRRHHGHEQGARALHEAYLHNLSPFPPPAPCGPVAARRCGPRRPPRAR